MTRVVLLILIGAATFFILLLATDPGLFEDVWLYVIGLSGAILKFFKSLWEKIKAFSVENPEEGKEKKAVG